MFVPKDMRFSVIIPLYNKAPYVCKALESVASQSFQNFELVVVDDGSKDGSGDIAASFLATTSLIYQHIRQKNAGVSTARNHGVASSNGEYICFLDADDWWEPAFLEHMDAFIRDYPEAGIYGTNYYYVKNGQKRICVEALETGYIHYCKAYACHLQMPLWTGAVCIPRGVFDEMGGFRPHLKLGEDFDLWIKIALKYKVAFLNEPLSNYYQDSDATWRGVGHLVNPAYHMLWNLDYLSHEERINPDYKQLIDNLRTYSLLPYFLSRQWHKEAQEELDKVDWKLQPARTHNLYNCPVWYLRLRHSFLSLGSKVKQWLIQSL